MARHNDFNFDLYRLNIIDDEGLFEFMGKFIRKDEQTIGILREACNSRWDVRQATANAVYVWGLRDFVELRDGRNNKKVRAFAIKLARATLEKEGVVITNDSISFGKSVSHPPPADFVTLVFHMTRHLVAAEFKSTVTANDGWLGALTAILIKVAAHQKYRSVIQLQPKPKKADILKSFVSFQRLTRLRVHLLLPNPDLSRFTRGLFDELRNGGIREYIADMRNPGGLSQEEMTLPHAAASMAEDGYKSGEVIMEGIKNGKRQTLKTGVRPARGKVENIRDSVQDLPAIIETPAGPVISDSLTEEIERLADEEI